MKNVFKLIFLFLFFALLTQNSQLFAQESKAYYLGVTTSDADQRVTDLYYEGEAGQDVVSGIFKAVERQSRKTTQLKVEQLKEGLVLVQERGKDVFILYSDDYEEGVGGNFELDFLYNGATGKRKRISFSAFIRNSEVVITQNGKRVNHAFIEGNRLLGKLIGVKNIHLKALKSSPLD